MFELRGVKLRLAKLRFVPNGPKWTGQSVKQPVLYLSQKKSLHLYRKIHNPGTKKLPKLEDKQKCDCSEVFESFDDLLIHFGMTHGDFIDKIVKEELPNGILQVKNYQKGTNLNLNFLHFLNLVIKWYFAKILSFIHIFLYLKVFQSM